MRLVLALLVLLALPAAARATDAATTSAVQTIIGNQIEAFRRDDAAGAYAFAAPGIRGMLPTPDAFMGMVQRGYRPVYRPRQFRFGATEDAPDGTVAQSVEIQDEDGADWIARYTLERGPDGAWLINGCTLLKAPGTAV